MKQERPKRVTEMRKTVETRTSVLITSTEVVALLRRELGIPDEVEEVTVETEGGGSHGDGVDLYFATGLRVSWKTTTTEEATF